MNADMNGLGPRDPEDDEIRRLIENAGPRDAISQGELDQMKSAAREVWRARVRSRRTRLSQGLALAAALTIAIIGGVLFIRSERPPVAAATVAHCERVTGEVVAIAEDDSSTTLKEGASVTSGERIHTGAGFAALSIGERVSLRLAGSTRVRVIDASHVELSNGAVYVDTGGHGGSLEVTTPYGTARDVGTQFVVKLDNDAETFSVSVREGEVIVRHGDEEESVKDGTTLAVSGDGSVQRMAVERWGAEWHWILDAAPRFDIEGRTLAEYLEWVERETGIATHYADPALENLARETTLHGSTGVLRPDEAVLVVLPGAGLEGSIEDGVLEVRRASE